MFEFSFKSCHGNPILFPPVTERKKAPGALEGVRGLMLSIYGYLHLMSAPTTADTRGDLPMLVVAPVILLPTYLPDRPYSRPLSELGSPVVARGPLE